MYDLHNYVLLNEKQVDLEQFKIHGVGVIFKNKPDFKKFKELKEQYSKLDLILGVEIFAERKGEIKKGIEKWRKQTELLIVTAKDQRAVRAACESKEIDLLAHAFIDQTAAREAGQHNVAIEINLRDILQIYGMKRSILASKVQFNLELARKYKVPIVLTTGAYSIYDMRNPKQIIALAECLGFKHAEAKNSLLKIPREIVQKNRQKRQGIEIAEGIKRVN